MVSNGVLHLVFIHDDLVKLKETHKHNSLENMPPFTKSNYTSMNSLKLKLNIKNKLDRAWEETWEGTWELMMKIISGQYKNNLYIYIRDYADMYETIINTFVDRIFNNSFNYNVSEPLQSYINSVITELCNSFNSKSLLEIYDTLKYKEKPQSGVGAAINISRKGISLNGPLNKTRNSANNAKTKDVTELYQKYSRFFDFDYVLEHYTPLQKFFEDEYIDTKFIEQYKIRWNSINNLRYKVIIKGVYSKKNIDTLIENIYLPIKLYKFNSNIEFPQTDISIKDIYIEYIKHIYPQIIEEYEQKRSISL
jgi:hypothetical protein